MKTKIWKYIFILLLIGVIIFAIYKIFFNKEIAKNKIEETEQITTEIKPLRIGISNFDTINPLLSNNKEVMNISKLIFEPLVALNENYKTELCLATECSKISPTSYIIKIDNNKKWQDGNNLKAEDIAFTIEKLKEGRSIYSSEVEKVSNVEILDDSTVKINLNEEVPFFEYHLIFPILPEHLYVEEDFYTSTKTPIGTGMYKISSISTNEITLQRNEEWWNIENKKAKIETIQVKLYAEMGEVYNSFKLGNVDIFTTSHGNLEQYIGTIGYAKIENKGREFDYLAFNCMDSILQHAEVRKALAYAIDKASIIASVYENEKVKADFPLDYGNYLYQQGKNSIAYNQEQAKNILQENGWQYQYNRWQKKENNKTNTLNLTLTVDSSNEKRMLVAENIKAQLEQIGIKVTIEKVSNSNYQKILQNKNYQMLLTGVYNSYTPEVQFFLGENNLQNYMNEEMNNLLTEVKQITDENLLKQKYQRIIEIYQEEQPFLSLYRNKQTIVKSQNLSGEVTGNLYFSYYHLENWHRI